MPHLFETAGPEAPIRAWIPGCATGEEAYSIAILLSEYADRQGMGNDLEIFGTDIDTTALALARKGSYGLDSVADLTAGHHARYFGRDGQRFRVGRRIRDGVVFSVHDLFTDPPLSRMNLVWCGSMTIGRSPELAELVFPLLARALVPGGFLVLGPSERVGPPSSLFLSVPGEKRTYECRLSPSVRAVRAVDPVSERSPPRLARSNPPASGTRGEALLLRKYAPPSAVVDESGQVLRYVGNTGAFLEPPPGPPSNNLIELARLEIRDVLRGCFHHAVIHREPSATSDVQFDALHPQLRVRIIVTPIVSADGSPHELVVAFEEQGQNGDTLQMMQAELKRARDDLIRSTEEFHYTNEELRSSNEELLSTNEELRAANEELDVLMEELRTSREDGAQVVKELSVRFSETQTQFNRARAQFARLRTAAVILDRELCIEDFNDASGVHFRLIEADRGRPLSDIAHRFRYDALVEDARRVAHGAETLKVVVQSDEESWYVVQLAPRAGSEGVEITVQEVDADIARAQLEAVNALPEEWLALQERPSALPAASGLSDGDAPPPSSLGNFAAEIAHEIKDPLNTIVLGAELALRSADPQRIDAGLHMIRDAAQRCGRIVSSVLGLAYNQTSSKTIVDLHVLVRHAAALMESYVTPGLVEVQWRLARAEALCLCNVTQVEQVFVNLFKNSVQATQPRKCCLLVTSRLTASEIIVMVTDNGPGMPPAVAERVFERLYSTRRGGSGTGLGLPLAREIMATHGGSIRVLSTAPGAGTSIELRLPHGEPA